MVGRPDGSGLDCRLPCPQQSCPLSSMGWELASLSQLGNSISLDCVAAPTRSLAAWLVRPKSTRTVLWLVAQWFIGQFRDFTRVVVVTLLETSTRFDESVEGFGDISTKSQTRAHLCVGIDEAQMDSDLGVDERTLKSEQRTTLGKHLNKKCWRKNRNDWKQIHFLSHH